MVSVFSPEDLILAFYDGVHSTDRKSSFAAWEPTTPTFRGEWLQAPPEGGSDISPNQLTSRPDGVRIHGNIVGGTTYNYRDVYTEGVAADLTITRDRHLGFQNGLDYDGHSNLWVSDWASFQYTFTKITPLGAEVGHNWNDSDPNLAPSGVDPVKMKVNSPGTRIYWNSGCDRPSVNADFLGVNIFNTETDTVEPWFDLTSLIPGCTTVNDIDIGKTTGYLYFLYNNVYLAVIDLSGTPTIIANELVLDDTPDCFGLAMAVNDCETLAAVMHSDPTTEEIVIVDLSTYNPLVGINWIADLSYTTDASPSGMCFAQSGTCGVLPDVFYPGIARVPRVGTTQDLFTRTTP